jgi:hypothetical protein
MSNIVTNLMSLGEGGICGRNAGENQARLDKVKDGCNLLHSIFRRRKKLDTLEHCGRGSWTQWSARVGKVENGNYPEHNP